MRQSFHDLVCSSNTFSCPWLGLKAGTRNSTWGSRAVSVTWAIPWSASAGSWNQVEGRILKVNPNIQCTSVLTQVNYTSFMVQLYLLTAGTFEHLVLRVWWCLMCMSGPHFFDSLSTFLSGCWFHFSQFDCFYRAGNLVILHLFYSGTTCLQGLCSRPLVSPFFCLTSVRVFWLMNFQALQTLGELRALDHRWQTLRLRWNRKSWHEMGAGRVLSSHRGAVDATLHVSCNMKPPSPSLAWSNDFVVY